MNFKKFLIIARKVIGVLFSMGFDKHLDYDQDEEKEEESYKGDER